MLIKRKNGSTPQNVKTDDAQKNVSGKLNYRHEIDEHRFEWSSEQLPDLNDDELRELAKTKLSASGARRIKQMMNAGTSLKQIIINLRGQRGFSVSSITKIHAALARAQKSKK